MIEIGAFEAKNTLGGLLDRVERGEEIVISRRGKPVARLVPAVPRAGNAGALRAVESLRAIAAELKGANFTQAELDSWRDEGRR